jgi:hypothetical protein
MAKSRNPARNHLHGVPALSFYRASLSPSGRKENELDMLVTSPAPDSTLAPDLLRGASEIAGFMFGEATLRRRVYHLAETSRLPVFKLGAVLCARRSVLMAWIAAQEKRGW